MPGRKNPVKFPDARICIRGAEARDFILPKTDVLAPIEAPRVGKSRFDILYKKLAEKINDSTDQSKVINGKDYIARNQNPCLTFFQSGLKKQSP